MFCFLCFAGLERDKFDNKTVSFEEHIKSEHNMWHYLYFLVLVKVKDPTEYTGPESYVAQMIVVSDQRILICNCIVFCILLPSLPFFSILPKYKGSSNYSVNFLIRQPVTEDSLCWLSLRFPVDFLVIQSWPKSQVCRCYLLKSSLCKCIAPSHSCRHLPTSYLLSLLWPNSKNLELSHWQICTEDPDCKKFLEFQKSGV